jgi:RimJ/RimL family protein N-acetyltransferase
VTYTSVDGARDHRLFGKATLHMAIIEPRVLGIRSGTATIRVSDSTDAEGTIALRLAMAQETEFLAEEPGEVRTDIEEQASFLTKKLSSPVDLYILAEIEGRIVGVASLDGSKMSRFEHGVRLVLGVRRDCWRQGLGRALVKTLVDWADTRGIVRIALEVVETNVGAIRLYESLGFEHEGRLRCRTKLGGRYFDNYLMARVRLPTNAA